MAIGFISLKSRYSHIVMLICAILAFVPVIGVDYMLDGYIRGRETRTLQSRADAITADVQNAVYGGIESARTVMANSASLCTPSFVRNVQDEMQANMTLRQMVVENFDGVQYCDAYGHEVAYANLSETLTIPGQSETIGVARLEGHAQPVLKITRQVGSRWLTAFVTVSSRLASGIPADFEDTTALQVALTNDTPVLTLGDFEAFEERSGGNAFVFANSFAGELPVRLSAAVPFLAVRANYADLDVSFTIIACLISGTFLALALRYVRRSQIPSIDLENAINSGELQPYYQPVIDLSSGRVLGCEVLVRWQKRNGEIVPPNVFIDYAEVTGLAIPMTLNLMQSVKRDLSEVCGRMPELKVSINLFEGHFRDSDIVEDVQAIFGNSNIGFDQLVFEITERRPLTNSMEAQAVITGFHAIGAKLALDDVGTGHSNLAYVQTLGVDVIKIDRIFVDMIKPDTRNVPVLDGLIAMAKNLGAEIVAEGVETEEQAIYLRERGVVQAQGYLFAPALKPAAFIELAEALNATFAKPRLEEDEALFGDEDSEQAGIETTTGVSDADAGDSENDAAA